VFAERIAANIASCVSPPLTTISSAWRSGLEQYLDGFAAIHRTVVAGDAVDLRDAIETPCPAGFGLPARLALLADPGVTTRHVATTGWI
jgi:hypothetical protein